MITIHDLVKLREMAHTKENRRAMDAMIDLFKRVSALERDGKCAKEAFRRKMDNVRATSPYFEADGASEPRPTEVDDGWKRVWCPSCRGGGDLALDVCETCNGRGWVPTEVDEGGDAIADRDTGHSTEHVEMKHQGEHGDRAGGPHPDPDRYDGSRGPHNRDESGTAPPPGVFADPTTQVDEHRAGWIPYAAPFSTPPLDEEGSAEVLRELANPPADTPERRATLARARAAEKHVRDTLSGSVHREDGDASAPFADSRAMTAEERENYRAMEERLFTFHDAMRDLTPEERDAYRRIRARLWKQRDVSETPTVNDPNHRDDGEGAAQSNADRDSAESVAVGGGSQGRPLPSSHASAPPTEATRRLVNELIDAASGWGARDKDAQAVVVAEDALYAHIATLERDHRAMNRLREGAKTAGHSEWDFHIHELGVDLNSYKGSVKVSPVMDPTDAILEE